jgi:hypothetical protein
MANPIRLSDELIKKAEKEAKSNFRTAPKQIELWASIGQEVESIMTPVDLAALINGEITIQLIRKDSTPISMAQVFNNIEADRKAGALPNKLVSGDTWYEESKAYPEYLIRVSPQGKELGTFKNGRFVVLVPAKKPTGNRKK